MFGRLQEVTQPAARRLVWPRVKASQLNWVPLSKELCCPFICQPLLHTHCREGYSKLFLLPLTTKKAAANKMQGTEILPSLSRLQAGNLTLDEAAGLGSQGGEEEAKVRYGFLKEEKEGLSDEEVMAEFKESKHGDEGGVFAAELPRAEVPRQPKGVPASEKENASK